MAASLALGPFLIALFVLLLAWLLPRGDWSNILENSASLAEVTGVFGAVSVLWLSGVVPRVGVVHCFWLGIQSRFRSASPKSSRAAEIHTLRNLLDSLDADNYVVVVGPRGVGKTCLIDTATECMWGVIKDTIHPGTREKEIVTQACAKIASIHLPWFSPVGSARRVLWWYNILPWTKEPILILSASEVSPGQQTAQITGATRTLRAFGIRVIIDASENSLDRTVLESRRQVILGMEPMDRQTVMEIPDFKKLFSKLTKFGLDRVVWNVVGGNPASLKQLWRKLDLAEDTQIEDMVRSFVQGLIGNALYHRASLLRQEPRLEKYLAKFQPNMMAFDTNDVIGCTVPPHNKVLREINVTCTPMLVPNDAAMAVVLKFHITRTPPWEWFLANLKT